LFFPDKFSGKRPFSISLAEYSRFLEIFWIFKIFSLLFCHEMPYYRAAGLHRCSAVLPPLADRLRAWARFLRRGADPGPERRL